MKTLLLDETGDLVLEQGSFLWIEGDEELAQSVRMILGTAKGEWFLDEEFGLDREPIFVKKFNENEARDSIIEALSVEPRIASVEEMKFTREGRVLSVDLTLRKQDGETLYVQGVNLVAG